MIPTNKFRMGFEKILNTNQQSKQVDFGKASLSR